MQGSLFVLMRRETFTCKSHRRVPIDNTRAVLLSYSENIGSSNLRRSVVPASATRPAASFPFSQRFEQVAMKACAAFIEVRARMSQVCIHTSALRV